MIASADQILHCALTRWSPQIGDPTPMGWATVAAYAATAVLALTVALRADGFPAATRGRERALWIVMTLLLAFLAVNKQLDLQSFMTAVGRCVSRAEGWYDQRRGVQLRFVVGLVAATALACLALLALMRRALARQWLALLGISALCGFVLVRAASFTHIDAFLKTEIGGWRWNWVLELGAIGLTALGALWSIAAQRR
ncbi:MAG: isopropylmalate isomerase [Rubrimonas sp.]